MTFDFAAVLVLLTLASGIIWGVGTACYSPGTEKPLPAVMRVPNR